MRTLAKRRRPGLTIVEILATVGAIAVLLSLGFSIYKGARHAVRVSEAQSKLRQLSTYMEVYFYKYDCYPPQGSDLVAALTSVGANPDLFSNPLMDEDTPGQTLNSLYCAPSLEELDSPDNYLTAFIGDDGHTAVILRTGGRVETCSQLSFDPSDSAEVLAMLNPDGDQVAAGNPPPDDSEDPTPPPDDTEDPTPPDDTEPEFVAGFEKDDDGNTLTTMCSDVYFHALGSQFGYADGTLVDIVTSAQLGNDDWFSLFGGQPVVGGEVLKLESVDAGTRVVVRAEIADPYTRWLWTRYGYPLSYASNDGSGQVVTLMNGDVPINNEPGFPYQVGVAGLLAPYIDPSTGRIALDDNQCLYCFDFNPLYTGFGIDYNDLVIMATAVAAEMPCDEDEPGAPDEPSPDGPVLAGAINLNPNNRSNFEFELVKPDGGTITRDDLHDNPDLEYRGPAVSIRVRPKGNGNQNSLYLDGELYRLRNGRTYVIQVQPGGQMTVYLYNDNPNGNGRSMGKWWLEINATSANITTQ